MAPETFVQIIFINNDEFLELQFFPHFYILQVILDSQQESPMT